MSRFPLTSAHFTCHGPCCLNHPVFSTGCRATACKQHSSPAPQPQKAKSSRSFHIPYTTESPTESHQNTAPFPTRTFSRRLPIQIAFFLKTLVASISLHLDSTGKGLIQSSPTCITLQKAIISLLDVKCLTDQHGPHSQTFWSLSPPISSLIPCFNIVHNVSQLKPTKADFSKPGRKRLIA